MLWYLLPVVIELRTLGAQDASLTTRRTGARGHGRPYTCRACQDVTQHPTRLLVDHATEEGAALQTPNRLNAARNLGWTKHVSRAID
jgi:hypothetical protein